MAIAESPARRPGWWRELLWPTIFTIVCGTILMSLGFWQLRRLAWKEGLIAEITSRAYSPPVALPAVAQWPHLKRRNYDYRHVKLAGRFVYDKTVRVFVPGGPHGMGPGDLLLTPVQLASNAYVIVNRGYVPRMIVSGIAQETAHASPDVRLTGLMRPPQSRNAFTPPDRPNEKRYFTRDPARICSYFHLTPCAPFVVDVDKTPGAKGWPRGGTTEVDLPNHHLNYALTWFGLATGLFGVFFSFVMRKRAEARIT